jgi:hypothetical protein
MKCLALLLVFTSCTTTKMIETDLYFGLTIPGGGEVSAAEWKKYNDETLGKIFTRGFTVYKTMGNWYDPDIKQPITENSYVVSVVNKLTPQLSARIDSIALIYKQRFSQQAVLRVDRKVKFKFL